MAIKNQSFCCFFLFTLLLSQSPAAALQLPSTTTPGGTWVLLQRSIGISAMHMQLLHNNKVVMYDRTDAGPSNITIPRGLCRFDHNTSTWDCRAHSVIYDVMTNTVRPLALQTNTWCSSGAVLQDGTLVQTGGYDDGIRVVRLFSPCDDDRCQWKEFPGYLVDRRWYSSNHILPDGHVIIVGGRSSLNYEFFPKDSLNMSKSYPLRLLAETTDEPKYENNLYPFLHLLPDGNLFVFANKRSILLDYKNNVVLKEFPEIPGEKRNYPSTGSSVLLPLKLSNTTDLPVAEVMICGGAPNGSTGFAKNRIFLTASTTCGRIKLTDPEPVWIMETMPTPRVMPDMLLLPTGDVLLINGATNGTAGWEIATNGVLNPVLYSPDETNPEQRFQVLNPTTIARMYHSTAIVLHDGRILVGGSNPHVRYDFKSYPYPTELSLEAFSPPYLAPEHAILRPSILSIESEERTITYGQVFTITFVLSVYRSNHGLSVTMMAPTFTTHSFSMNQRLLVLNVVEVVQLSVFGYKVVVSGPPTPNIAPPGHYIVFVVHAGIPSQGVWLKLQ